MTFPRSAPLLRSLAILAVLLLVLSPLLSHLPLSHGHSQAYGVSSAARVTAPVQPSGTAAGLQRAHSADADVDASPARDSEQADPSRQGTASACEACQLAARVLLLLMVVLIGLLPAARSSALAGAALPGLPARSHRQAHPPRGPPLPAVG